MDPMIQQVLEVARAMWRRRWVGIAVAWVVLIVGAVTLWLVPNRYEASARVYVDTKSVLRPLLRDITVEPDLDQAAGLLARTLITRPNVELLIRKSNLEAPGASRLEHETLVDTLTRTIKVAGVSRDNVFNFSYRDTDPARARQVVQNLVSLFLESDTGAKRVDAQAAREFIDDQIKNYEARLSEAEDRLKAFRLRNLDIMDSSGKDYFTRMTALTDDLAKANVELRAAEESRDALKRELGGETVSLVPDVLPSASITEVPEVDARLEAQRKQLDDLLRRFTDQHPDVVATRRLIASLEAERQKKLEALRKAADAKRTPAPIGASTAQQQIKLALAESEAQVAAIRVRTDDMRARLAALRASASKVPEVEAELAKLNRDYEVIRGAYQTMVARREKAALSEDVDATRSTQFRIIDPPRVAPEPVSPNRMVLAPLILVLALGAGAAAAFLVVQFAPTIDNARLLRLATQRPVLGSVSLLTNDDTVRRARRASLGFASAFGGLALVAAGWIAWISMQIRH